MLPFVNSFKVSRTYEPIHTGGKVALSGDGSWLVSTLNEQALVSEVSTGKRLKELVGVSLSYYLFTFLCLFSLLLLYHKLTAISNNDRIPQPLQHYVLHHHHHHPYQEDFS